MFRFSLLPAVAAIVMTAGTAMAQDAGGIGFAPGQITASNMAQAFAQPPRMPVFATGQRRGAPPGAMVTNPGVSRSAVNQQAIAKVRGDAGFLAGFSQGQPLAGSRQAPVSFPPFMTFVDASTTINNIGSAVNFAFGDGNVANQHVVLPDGETPVTAGQQPDATPTTINIDGATINNVGSVVNVASGKGNVANQSVFKVQR